MSWPGIQNPLVFCDFQPLSAKITGMYNCAWLSRDFLKIILKLMFIKYNLNVHKST